MKKQTLKRTKSLAIKKSSNKLIQLLLTSGLLILFSLASFAQEQSQQEITESNPMIEIANGIITETQQNLEMTTMLKNMPSLKYNQQAISEISAFEREITQTVQLQNNLLLELSTAIEAKDDVKIESTMTQMENLKNNILDKASRLGTSP